MGVKRIKSFDLGKNVYLRVQKTLKSWLLLLLLAGIWGSSFILMKKGMYTENHEIIFDSLQVGSLRMLIASSALLPFALRSLRLIKHPKDWLFFITVGCCGNFFPAFLFTYAETGVSSGYAGMLNSFTPIFTLIIGWLVFKQKLTPIQLTGAGIGTLGILLLVYTGKHTSQHAEWKHILSIVLATLLYGISLNTIKHRLQHYPSVGISALAFFTIFIPSLIAFFVFGTPNVISNHPHATEGLTYIAILALIGTAGAVVLFNIIIRLSSTLFASSVTYLIPIVAVIIGTYFGEKITFGQLLSMGVILIGILFANYGHYIISRLNIN